MHNRLKQSFLFIAVCAGTLSAQVARDPAPLKNWTTPLFWQPNESENQMIARKGGPQPLVQGQPSAKPAVFVAMTPCRLVDTRAGSGYLGQGMSLQAQVTQTYQIYNDPSCSVPSIAVAYSLNVTVLPPPGGYVGFLTVWPGGNPPPARPTASTLNDVLASQNANGPILANAAIVPAGTDAEGSIQVYSFNNTDLVIDINGYFAAQTDANFNTATGLGALGAEQPGAGADNTATGYNTLASNTSGGSNTAIGFQALLANTTGGGNTGTGNSALGANTTGNRNSAQGDLALASSVGGSLNTAMGYASLSGLGASGAAGGSSNIALGSFAGQSLATGSSNIYIGADLPSGTSESNIIRIGFTGQTATYIGGIFGSAYGPSQMPVYIGSNGQLGTPASSIRYKEDVQDMGDSSSNLLKLRPVTFRYKQPYEDGSKPLDYGLIAEEVEEVYPDLVVKDKNGQVQTVQYQKLTPMLLNELQKQHEELLQQREENRALLDRITALEALVTKKDPAGQ